MAKILGLEHQSLWQKINSFPVFPYKSLNTNLLKLNGKTDLRKIKIENSPPEFEKLDS